ncbi:MAG: metallophosphoesterase family protein [Gemmataceae bacterium]
MKRILLGLCSLVLLGAAAAWSRSRDARPELVFAQEDRNPVTHLRMNNDADNFQFAIVSDRTGGHRARVFSRAMDQLNLLQPELVLSVGDLIEGYSRDKKQADSQWREFQNYTSRLHMPFFYVPGNHDISNPMMASLWKDKFGRSYYHFVYRNTLFLALNTEDPPGKEAGSISETQLKWLEDTLKANAAVRWTLVFLHKPMWLVENTESNGWAEVEKRLQGRSYTVFAGHVHRYQKFTRNKMAHYMLGTTGGDSKLRGPETGEVDHIVWVTMKKDGPLVANLLLDGIQREDLTTPPSEEEGVREYNRPPTYPTTLTLTYKGQPLSGAYVYTQSSTREIRLPTADGFTDATGTVKLSTFRADDGVAAGNFAILVEQRKPLFLPDGKLGPNQLPDKYRDIKTTPLSIRVLPGTVNNLKLDLAD